MDIILRNKNGEDEFIIDPVSFDIAVGIGDNAENDFELTVPANAPRAELGQFVYIEGTPYGGMITRIKSDGAYKWHGQTWQGLLNNRVILAPSDGDNVYFNGDMHQVLKNWLSWLSLTSVFEVSDEPCAIVANNYKVPLYSTLYEALTGALDALGGKLRIQCNDRRAVLSIIPRKDWTDDEEFDTALTNVKADIDFLPVNHLVCRGKGQKGERLAVELYADENGNISRMKSQSGIFQRDLYYDYSAADQATLEADGRKKLQQIIDEAKKLTVVLTDTSDRYDIGDIVGGFDDKTGWSAKAQVTKKVVTLDSAGVVKVTYTTGDAK